MARRGWLTDAFRPSVTRCPKCIEAKKAIRNDNE